MSHSDQIHQIAAADWRKLLRINKRRTRFVILSFILIYLLIGILIDLYRYAGMYPDASLSQLFFSLVTFQLKPQFTMLCAGIAVISLVVTFLFHNKLMLLGAQAREITPETARSLPEKQLYNTVGEMKVAAGLRYMPKVFVIEADYMNAFASGYTEKSAMVAITRGLLEKLDRAELQAVMAHELSHVRHGDIRVLLMASILANLLLILIDMLFYGVLFGRQGNGNRLRVVIWLLRITLPVVTMLLILYLSRSREYMADAGSVELTRQNEPLARALLKIQEDYKGHKKDYAQALRKTPHESVRRHSYIFDPTQVGLSTFSGGFDLFSSHPSITKRLAALGIRHEHH